ncbi:MAG: ribonuclease Y [Candidatus Kapabacteria bacterium]|nr:ribonuclease Y [Candidatus Kapabacteria bacterium]MDW8011994.1 ribonuclease Y [Bacteroidota bacterium]
MTELWILATSLLGLIGGFVVAYLIGSRLAASKLAEAERQARRVLEEAEREAKALKKEKLLELKEEWQRQRQEFEAEVTAKRNKLQALERQLKSREEALQERLELIQRKERHFQTLEQELAQRQQQLEQKLNEAHQLVQEQITRLEQIAGISREQAKQLLMENLLNEARNEAAQYIRQIREEARLTAEREAKSIIVQAIQRTAADHSMETTVTVVQLPNEEMKGRIIGREGRNIRAFEAATGVDLIIDDTPEAVVLSCFDPFRREVARIALERLIADGRIHPARIEEVVEKVRRELEESLPRIGQEAAAELGLHNLHPKLLYYIGKMRFRSSYGQNLLAHSLEVARLAGIMAAELRLDPHLAKRAGLLHDVGKCVENADAPHALVGYELLKRYNEHPVVCNAVGAHHEDIPMESPIAALVQAADAVSGARPGARRETLEEYVRRLEQLESLANSFAGVVKSYAIQAGREIRVIVEPERIDDQSAEELARQLAARIETEMQYPGQVKVTVIREVRKTAVAR